ncbi:flavin-containing monooxygenase [Ferrimonas aestuarii]|uniref:NAD(P)/FAD-dependent oxidoreductase n=1 Tax=Ferrimonas aestuarii TaxID=2569539 RepID=A0A4V5NWB7_9GAMM|nr:NAD(P)/FAD-dependent oxidoreductase [Ferrimonas aestuarii]TKB56534.1 NAD(P)/FAD-dependent oxidoreductase [Ferrimonas aestuarii]
MTQPIFDVVIIGAGLSGIGVACRIKQAFPNMSMAILERRQQVGGTWDLFNYPGIRSDSDMASFGYEFRPWHSDKVLAQGPDIKAYVRQTAQEHRIYDDIQFRQRVLKFDWSTSAKRWTLTTSDESSGDCRAIQARFVVNCTGYYNFDKGYTPDFAGREAFKGDVIHPQHWPDNYDYRGKKVVVIGSGATAVTLIPSMAEKAAHITMLQRSPTYIMAMPNTDSISKWLYRILPRDWVFRLARKRNTWFQRALYLGSMRWPNFARKRLLASVKKQLGDDFDMSHLTPKYNPWEQRLCAAPDGDFFEAINAGKASICTDEVKQFNESGIELKSGQQLDADLVITATGLEVQMLGGAQMHVDGVKQNLADKLTYKGIMLEGIPNLTWIFGYTNAPWTLKCDIAGRFLTRLFAYMQEHQLETATAIDSEDQALDIGILDSFAPGYVQRARHILPRQGKSGPWRVTMHYGKDKRMLLKDPINDGLLVFDRGPSWQVTAKEASGGI